jgi:hypothetical protein
VAVWETDPEELNEMLIDGVVVSDSLLVCDSDVVMVALVDPEEELEIELLSVIDALRVIEGLSETLGVADAAGVVLTLTEAVEHEVVESELDCVVEPVVETEEVSDTVKEWEFEEDSDIVELALLVAVSESEPEVEIDAVSDIVGVSVPLGVWLMLAEFDIEPVIVALRLSDIEGVNETRELIESDPVVEILVLSEIL